MGDMTKVLKDAIAEVSNLPESDQQMIGCDLLSYVEKLRRLRVEIDKGIRSLDAGEGKEVDIEVFIQDMNARNGGA
jgi:hypothetical protein